jgi:hypothetical protein
MLVVMVVIVGFSVAMALLGGLMMVGVGENRCG